MARKKIILRPITGTDMPNIDSSTPETWASTWISKLLWTMDNMPDVYKNSPKDLAADSYAGDLPWMPTWGDRVSALIKEDSRWAGLLERLQAFAPNIDWSI